MFSKNLKNIKQSLASLVMSSMLFINLFTLGEFLGSKVYAEAGESVTTNLVNWYKFNENSGVTVGDEIAPAANGTLTNGTAWSVDVPSNTAPNNSSVSLDGTNDYVVSAASPGLPTGDFSYTVWAKPTDGTDGNIFMASNGSASPNEDELIISMVNGKVRVFTNNVARVTSDLQLSAGNWNHLVVTRTGATIRIYINGRLDRYTGTDAGALNFGVCPLLIGADSGGGCSGSLSNFWKGKMDDVRVYSSALTQADIDSIYNIVSNGALKGPGGVTSAFVNGASYTRYDTFTANASTGLTGPVIETGYVASISFPAGVGFVQQRNADTFGLEMRTKLRIVNAGVYQFRLNQADDTGYLSIDGVQYLNTTGNTTATGANINLSAGDHDLVARFSDAGGADNFEVQWRGTVAGLDTGTTMVNLPDNKQFVQKTGPSSWHKADSGVAGVNGATPSFWADSSINQNSVATEATMNPILYTTNPAELINFNPSVLFTDDSMPSSNFTDGYSYSRGGKTVFTVAKADFVAVDEFITGYGDESSGGSMFYIGQNNNLDVGGMGSSLSSATNIWDTVAPKLVAATYENQNLTTINNAKLFNGGVQIAQGTRNWSNNINNSYTLTIGKRVDDINAKGFRGNIGEVIYFPWDLSAAEQQRVNSYLAAKYGITTDSSPTINYVASDGATSMYNADTVYNKNVTVIGRDDGSELLQKQSKSQNATALVTVGKSQIVATNISNTGAFSADKSFLSFADDEGSLNWTNTGAPIARKVVTRKWKVTESGANATDYIISTPDNSSTLPTKLPIEATTVYMLIDADGDFTSGATEVPMTLVGTEWITTATDLNNGQFFTFATRDVNPGGVAGVTLWTKANDAGCAEGTNCTSWQDHSTNLNPVETTAGGKNLFASDAAHNFNPYFTNFGATSMFVDDNGSISPNGIQTNTEQTIFAAARAISAGSGRILGQDNETPASSNAAEPGLGIQGGAQHFYRFWNTTQNISSTNTVTANKTSVFDWRTSGTSLTMGLDGKNTTHAITAQTTWGNTVNIGYGSYPGGGVGGTGAFPGDIQEVIWYNTSLSNVDRQKINSYLSTKYGVTLDQTTAQNYVDSIGAVYWNAAIAGTYNKNITVIGRDDASGLEQKQSKSVNPVSLVTVGKSVILANNASNTGVFEADKDYLSFADNGIAIAGFSATGAPIDKNIIARTWKVQETGTNAIDYKISAPDNTSVLATKLPQDNGNTVYLAQDADGNFAAGATFVPMTLVGTNWEISNVDLNNGVHFTFAINAPGITTGPGLTILETASGTVSVVLDAIPGGNVVINLTSSDAGAATVAPATMTFTTANWNVPQIATVTGVADPDILNENVTISATVNAALSSNEYDTVPTENVAIAVTDTNVAGFSISATAVTMSENVGTQNFTAVLTSQPTSNVVLDVVSSSPVNGTVSPASLTFTNSNWNVPQTITVTAVNDAIDQVVNDTSTINISVNDALSDNTFDVLVDQTVTASFTDDDTAGVIVTLVDNLTGEDGATGNFNIVLKTEPLGNVIVNLSSTNAAEGTGSVGVVTFTPLNWNVTQNITVTGIDDVVPTSDGAITYSIVTGDITSTLDTIYDAMDGTAITDMLMQNQDNDAPGVTMLVIDGDTSETGATAKVQFTLLAQPAGGADLTIPLSISNASEGTISASSITILNANWNTPANNEITITGVDDFVQDGTISYLLVTGDPTSSDPIQDSLTAASIADANINNSDNDMAGVTIIPIGTSTAISEAGLTDTYDVVLNTAPTSNVILTINAGTQVTTLTTTLTFTPANYNTPQTVTITAVDDLLLEGAHIGTITHTSASTDINYDSLLISSVAVNIIDNEVADTTAPSAPVVNSIDNSDTSITGTGEVGVTINVTNATCTNAPVIVQAGGTWTCNLSSPLTTSTVVNVTATDASSNTSAATASTVTAVVIPDTSAPSTATINPIDNNDTTITGTGEPRATVNVTGATCTNSPIIVQASGTWSCTLATLIITGTTITITQTDTAGNASAPATTDVANAVTILATSTPVVVNPIGNTDTQITGIAAPGSTINVTGATCTNAPVIANAAGVYTCNLASSPTADDVITVTATEIGKAPSAPSTTTVSNAVTTAPSAPSVNPTNGSTLSGTGEPGATVNITGATCSNSPVIVSAGGTWVCNISPAPGNGSTITVTQTDNGGNVSGPTSVIVDSIAPSAPIVNPVTSTANPITGTGTPGNTITVTGATCTNAPVIVNASGTWTCNLATAPAPRATITVTESDPSGNVSVPNVSAVPGIVVSSGGGGGVVAFFNNTVQSVKDLFIKTDVKNEKKSLIGGEEANVPAEFSNQVCKRYLKEYILPNKNNNPEEVKKLQEFLNQNEGEKLVVDGTYDNNDIEAVKRFQAKYASQILYPWDEAKPTGRVFRTTTAKINLMSCAKNTACPYFTENLKLSDKSLEVVKIQDFLNIIFAPTSGYPTKGIPLSKDMTDITVKKVREYQKVYKDSVLKPLGLKSSTGWWYDKSRAAANQLMGCSTQ